MIRTETRPDSTMFDFDENLHARIKRNLDSFPSQNFDSDGLKRAAVAITVAPAPDNAAEAAFLLTQRASTMNRHAGQWALPGGRLDPGETPEQAARRELCEELAVTLPADACLGPLDDYVTRSGYVISPLVFWLWEAPVITPNPNEVAAVHHIPVHAFDRPDSPEFEDGPDPERPLIRIRLGEHEIHAPTGAILYQFWTVGLNGSLVRVAHYDQPDFAWR